SRQKDLIDISDESDSDTSHHPSPPQQSSTVYSKGKGSTSAMSTARIPSILQHLTVRNALHQAPRLAPPPNCKDWTTTWPEHVSDMGQAVEEYRKLRNDEENKMGVYDALATVLPGRSSSHHTKWSLIRWAWFIAPGDIKSRFVQYGRTPAGKWDKFHSAVITWGKPLGRTSPSSFRVSTPPPSDSEEDDEPVSLAKKRARSSRDSTDSISPRSKRVRVKKESNDEAIVTNGSRGLPIDISDSD
ncbi:hypothetical protein DL93DRAFT_2197435, partial [Clavulina sp. PMI_390]